MIAMRLHHMVIKTAAIAASALLIFSLSGCVTGSGPRNFVRADANITALKKIAVMPFESFVGNDEYAGEKIRRVVMTELLMNGFEVMEPGEVSKELGAIKKALQVLTVDDLKKIAKTLGVDALMMGSVETYKISPGLTVPYPDVSINLRLFDAASGNVSWSIVHTSGGPGIGSRHFGTEGPSLGDAAHRVVRESIDALISSRRGS